MASNFKIEGLDNLQKEMNRLEKAFKGDKTKDAAKRPAEMLRDSVKQKAPVGPTGNLKRSVQAKELDYVWIAAVDQKIAPHAHLLEFGTVNMPAQPFFRTGIEAASNQAVKEFHSNLAKLVDKAVK